MIEYTPLFLIFFFAGIFSSMIPLVSFFVAARKIDPEKISAYECGFDPFDDARHRFDIQFYLVAILFIIFDLEVSFLFPWACTLHQISFFGFWSMMIFLLILTLGFFYEWRKGGLDWNYSTEKNKNMTKKIENIETELNLGIFCFGPSTVVKNKKDILDIPDDVRDTVKKALDLELGWDISGAECHIPYFRRRVGYSRRPVGYSRRRGRVGYSRRRCRLRMSPNLYRL